MTSPLSRLRPGRAALALALLAGLAVAAAAQQPTLRVEVEPLKVGFLSYDREGNDYYYAKPDLWAPVHVTLKPDDNSNIALPVGPNDNFVRGELRLETADNDGTLNIY